jgi:hypothetical protein
MRWSVAMIKQSLSLSLLVQNPGHYVFHQRRTNKITQGDLGERSRHQISEITPRPRDRSHLASNRLAPRCVDHLLQFPSQGALLPGVRPRRRQRHHRQRGYARVP